MPRARGRVPFSCVAAVLFLTACGGAAAGEAPVAQESAQLDPYDCWEDVFREANLEFCFDSFTASTPLTTGPATEPATYDNGLEGRIVSVTAEPSAGSTYRVDPGDDTLVEVVVEIGNTGSLPVALPDEEFLVGESLYYGASHREALEDGAQLFVASRHELAADEGGRAGLPRELAPGASATTTSVFSLPSAELDELTFVFNPSRRILPDWTFSAVSQLLP